nr:MAG TPA: hypothetical protein [Caudoviricetes sp.]
MNFTDVFQYYDVRQVTQIFKILIFTGMNQNKDEIRRALNRRISILILVCYACNVKFPALHHSPCARYQLQ